MIVLTPEVSLSLLDEPTAGLELPVTATVRDVLVEAPRVGPRQSVHSPANSPD
ncbi:MAG: hypothetical protein J07HX64_00901 [halophilic archaeon J07HX64]|nr:MAG: hypothetical protein J07HX64_00901 [halophilic archaeon J07HX64]